MMLNLHQFKQDIYSRRNLGSKVYKQYAQEIEEYLLELNDFPDEILYIYLEFLNTPQTLQLHGIYRFFKQLYFDFDKLSLLQRQQLKLKIIECLQHPVENNVELWLSETIQILRL